jgi:hypothetical protein
MVTVYAFTRYDIGTEAHRPVKATRETIERISAAIIEASAEEVDASLLDGLGYYRPKAKNFKSLRR